MAIFVNTFETSVNAAGAAALAAAGALR